MQKSASLLTCGLIIGPAIAQGVGAEDVQPYTSSGNVQFIAGSGPVDPINPTDPSVPVNPTDPDGKPQPPGGTGPLSIDFASSFYFGQQAVTTKKAYAHAQVISDVSNTPTSTEPNYVQITDQRGTFEGWSLTVSTDSTLHLTTVDPTDTPETSDTTPGDYLTGATISFTGGYLANKNYTSANSPVGVSNLILNNSAQNLVTAQTNTGVGTWVYGFGNGISGQTQQTLNVNNLAYQEAGGTPLSAADVSTKSPIVLNIPDSTNPKAAAYTTNLIWTLSETPTNS